MIRIIAGEYRHREVVRPATDETRPTQDRIREALFSALGYTVNGRVALDLFAGSGALGFEALSRGADKVVLVDKAKDCIAAMNKTKASFKCGDEVEIIQSDALNFIKTTSTKFGLVFLDPPYKNRSNSEIIKTLLTNSLLTDNAIIVREQDYDIEEIEQFTLKTYRYGEKRIGIYRRIV